MNNYRPYTLSLGNIFIGDLLLWWIFVFVFGLVYSPYVVLFLFSVYTHVEWMDCSDTEKEFGGVGV